MSWLVATAHTHSGLIKDTASQLCEGHVHQNIDPTKSVTIHQTHPPVAIRRRCLFPTYVQGWHLICLQVTGLLVHWPCDVMWCGCSLATQAFIGCVWILQTPGAERQGRTSLMASPLIVRRIPQEEFYSRLSVRCALSALHLNMYRGCCSPRNGCRREADGCDETV